MRLYHYSNINIEDKLKVKHFGHNSYTNNDGRISSLKRSFCFTSSIVPEARFQGSHYRYTLNIPKKDIYNLISDSKKLVKSGNTDINGLLRAIKKLGYKGVLYNVGYNIVNLFYDIKYIKKDKKGVYYE